MPGPNSAVTVVDGSLDFSGGVDTLKVTTIQSSQNPNGIARNELCFLTNGNTADGGITPRGGWKFDSSVSDGSAWFQGAYQYNPPSGDPYFIAVIGGHVLKVVPGQGVTDLSVTAYTAGTTNFGVLLQNIDAGPIGTAITAGSAPPIGAYTGFNVPAVGKNVRVGVTTQYTGALGAIVEIGLSSKQNWFLQSQTHRWYGYRFSGMGFGNFIWESIGDYVIPPSGLDFNGHTYLQIKQGDTDPDTIAVDGPIIDHATVASIGNPSQTINGALIAYASDGQPCNIITSLGYLPGHYYVAASTAAPGFMPADRKYVYFCQAEQWLIIQAGDLITPALFWDGLSLRSSLGINDDAIAPGTPGINEIPPSGPMCYYLGRVWWAEGNKFSAGDIVRGNSGTLNYQFLDSVLNVTESPLILGGDGFSTPSDEGDITALRFNATQDAALGQGRLFAFTSKGAHALTVPVTRSDWIATTKDNVPMLVPIQLANGTPGDRSIVAVNGDLFYQSAEPAIRTLKTAVRQFQTWGNIPISAEMDRVVGFTDRSLLRFSTGILFGNRLIQSQLPKTLNQGVVHQSLIVMDFTPLYKFNTEVNPVWEGMYEGLDFLQLVTAIFDGEERAFAFIVSRHDQTIQLWEVTQDDKFDGNDTRITMPIEFPAFTWGQEFALKKLVSAELWIDRLYGEVEFTMEWRPDGDPCWKLWHKWKQCSARNSCEDVFNPICYPLTPFRESFRATMTLPKPPEGCESITGRPAYIGYQMQPRLTIKGFCRVRGILLHAEWVERKLYDHLVC